MSATGYERNQAQSFCCPGTFDDIGRTMATLFEMSTLEGYINVLHRAANARGVGRQPVPNYSQWTAINI